MIDAATAGPRVLIVDDDNLICWALAHELSAEGLDVSTCRDGTDAIGRIRAARYDLAILDVHLPDANGIELLEEIKRGSPGTRVVVISADAGPACIRRAIAAGAEDFIEKPFEPSAVRARVLGMIREYPVPRSHPRFACRIPVRISVLAPVPPAAGFANDALGGIAEDVGRGGTRVATDYPLAAGQIVRVKAAATPADPLLHLFPSDGSAEVRWTAMAAAGFSAGLSFRTPPAPREASREGAA